MKFDYLAVLPPGYSGPQARQALFIGIPAVVITAPDLPPVIVSLASGAMFCPLPSVTWSGPRLPAPAVAA